VFVTGRNQAKLDEAVARHPRLGRRQGRGVLADAATADGAATILKAVP
jgi:hypothetical protein